jgi:DNA helicase-2/ATP-dependent DNA helicase PcrA
MPIVHARTPEAIEEERRLLYVAVTRAREHLALSWAPLRARAGTGLAGGAIVNATAAKTTANAAIGGALLGAGAEPPGGRARPQSRFIAAVTRGAFSSKGTFE